MGKTVVKVKQANKAKANPQLTAEKQKKKAARGGETNASVAPVTNDE